MHIWILGPCCMESAESYIEEGKILSEIMDRREIMNRREPWYFKASFDKANRTSVDSKRGIGLEEGIKAFQQIKKEIPKIQLITDVHETNQVEQLAGIVDAIQVPAFLCRQTDLIVACAKYFNVVNVKKGQWMPPEDAKYIARKIEQTNPNCRAMITERGTSLGYGSLVVDFGSVPVLKRYFDDVILDCTHSTQRSISGGNVTGGNRDLAEKYMHAAPIFNYDGIFAEVHPCPAYAFSDKDCQIPLNKIEGLIKTSSYIDQQMGNFPHAPRMSE